MLAIFRSLPSPIYGLDNIYENKVITISFRDPKYADGFIFEAKRLPGAIEPPNVLAPEHRPSNYRPQIGFNRNFPQASLGEAGHRFINHHSGWYKQQPQQQQQFNDNRNYASIAPPNNYRNGEYTNILLFVANLMNTLGEDVRTQHPRFYESIFVVLISKNLITANNQNNNVLRMCFIHK